MSEIIAQYLNRLNMKSIKLLLPIIILYQGNIFSKQPGQEQPINQRSYIAERLQTDVPRIDGVISETAWDAAEWAGDFIQLQPYEKNDPSQKTEFKIIYDDNNLYVALKMYDTATDSIVRRMSRRDGFDGDWIEINIDSYHDKRTAFSFTVNAAGVKGDEAITNDGNWDSSWDPIWYVKTAMTKEGWTAEMCIPLSQLRFGKQTEYTWGLQVNRLLFRKGERSSWQFISPNASGWVHNFGVLIGIRDIVPRKQKDLTPYLLGKYESYQKEENNPFADGSEIKGQAGLDGKFGLTNDLTLDFTINPDFGQVEADPSEVNLTTYETFFPEKRTFFIEGRNILSHQIVGGGGNLSMDNLFYSRRIGSHPSIYPDVDEDQNEYARIPGNTTILGAFKVTGKTRKGLSVGLMESCTQEEKADVSRNGVNSTEIAEPFTNYFVSRIEQDMNNSNTQIGAIVTSVNRNLKTDVLMNSLHHAAYTGGINFSHHWKDKTYYLNLNYVMSQVQGSQEAIYETQTNAPHFFQRPDAAYLSADSTRTHLAGQGGTIQIGKAGNSKWMFTNWYTWRSPGLNLNDIGYMRSNDEIQEVFWVGYYQSKPVWIFRQFNLNFNQWYGLTFNLDKRYFGGNVNAYFEYKNQWSTGFGVSRDSRSLSTDALRGGPSLIYDPFTEYWFNMGTNSRARFRINVYYSGGRREYGSDWYNNFGGTITYRVSDAFNISMSPSASVRMDKIAFVSNIDDIEPVKYVRGEIHQTETALTLRFTYNITPDFTIQYYGMPFISAGRYDHFKYIDKPHSDNFYERYAGYSDDQIHYNDVDDNYAVDEDRNGMTDYTFDNPDFNVLDFNSNLVIRWEYMPGSTLYLVWTQQRNRTSARGTYSFPEDTQDLFAKTYPYDVFLIKLSYRFGL
jgi:hypothetical protein